jgi:hypothetical protein
MNRFVMALLLTGLVADSGCAADTATSTAYTVLDDTATQLREDFNKAKGSVRLIFVVDPICPGCLRGLDDVDVSLLRKTSDPRIQTFVVHVPALGAEAKDVARSFKLLHNAHVRHYWNESGAFGGLISKAVDLRANDGEWVYAWDVWLVYGPEAMWEGAAPPQPKLLMQQLYALRDSKRFPRLDSDILAQQVRALLVNATPAAKTH